MKKTTKFLALLLCIMTAASVASCKKGDGESSLQSSGSSSSIETPVTSENIELSLNKSTLTLVEDEVEVLVATSNVSRTVTWTSDNEQVATVSVVGQVIAKTAGTAKVTARIGDTTAECVVTVTAASPKTEDYINVESTAYLSLKDETTPQILPRYIAIGENGEEIDDTKAFTFESLNTAVVTVDECGVITPIDEGTADIVVRCGDVVTYVVADVYTSIITTTEEWMEIFVEKDLFARYYLATDLDFTGKEYNIGKYAGREQGFYGELNGGFHTVSNVTVTGDTGTEGQSLFGGAKCVNIHDVAFMGVKYTDSRASGICSSLMQHVNLSDDGGWAVFGDEVVVNGKVVPGAIPLPDMDKIIFPSKINNVILDAEFIGHGNVGFCKSFYGGIINDLYLNLRRGDDDAFSDSDYMFTQTLHIWYLPNAASNTVIRIDKGMLSETINKVDSYDLPMSDVTYTVDEMKANYKAYQMFDTAVWSITPKGIPTFAK